MKLMMKLIRDNWWNEYLKRFQIKNQFLNLLIWKLIINLNVELFKLQPIKLKESVDLFVLTTLKVYY